MSTTPAKMTGVTFITIDGRRIRSAKGATFSPGGKVGKSVMSTLGFEGIATDEIKPAKIKCTINHCSQDDATSAQEWRGKDVTFETDSGQTYLIVNAGTVGEVSLKDGDLEVELEGAPAELL